MSDESFEIKSSESWSDDEWYKDQDNRKLINNYGWLVINEGKTEGTILELTFVPSICFRELNICQNLIIQLCFLKMIM